MKKLYALLVLPMLMALSVHAQDKPLEKSLLWEISGNGLEKPSYLFGTIHAICSADLSKKVTNAVKKAEVVVLEVDMDDIDLGSLDPNLMFMRDGKTITDFLEDSDIEKLKGFFVDNTGSSLMSLGNVSPFFLNASLIPHVLNCNQQAIDIAVMNFGKQNDKEILGLETLESQFAVFDSIPYKSQFADLMNYVNDGWDSFTSEFAEMLNYYEDEDISGLYAHMMQDDMELTTKYKDLFLDNRNKAWIPVMQGISNKQSAFYAVGAGHLAGKTGVINLLRSQGYIVTPIFE